MKSPGGYFLERGRSTQNQGCFGSRITSGLPPVTFGLTDSIFILKNHLLIIKYFCLLVLFGLMFLSVSFYHNFLMADFIYSVLHKSVLTWDGSGIERRALEYNAV